MRKIIAAATILFSACSVYAGIGYYNNYQHIIGNRAAGLGGAYTALADDSSSLWYNPAGLANIKTYNLNVSANGYNYINTEIDGYVEIEDEGGEYKELNWRDKDISVVAHTLAYAKHLGGFGTIGFGIFVPFQDDIHGIVKGEAVTSTYALNLRFESNISAKSIYGFAGYGNSLGKNFNFGISLGVGYLTERAKDTVFELIEFFDDTAYNFSGYYIYEASGYVMEASLGFQYFMGERHILGLKISSPAYSLYYKSSDKVVEMYAGTDVLPSDPNETIYLDETLRERDSSLWEYYPAQVSLGYAYRIKNSLAFSFDVVPSFKTDEYPETVINYKGGIEIHTGKDLAVHAGFFTDFSQKGELEAGDDNQNSLDYYGAALGLTFGSELSSGENSEGAHRLLTTLGVMYRWGSGKTKTSRYDRNADDVELLKDQSISSFTFFIGETIRFE